MVPIKFWKEKRIVAEESRAADDIIDDPVDDQNNDGNSVNSEHNDMDINMVFALPAEFCAWRLEEVWWPIYY